jgi:hypothetical protein
MDLDTIIYRLNDRNYGSIITNYLDNFIESNIHIYHPDYIHQIISSEYIQKNDIKIILTEIIDEFYIKKRENIRELIKKNKFSLNSLNNIIIKFKDLIISLENLSLKFDDINQYFIKKIFSDQILIKFLITQITNTDNISDIEILCKNIDKYSEEYRWFLKLIGTSYYNLLDFKIDNVYVPEKYKMFYELKYFIDNINSIKKIFNFIENINYIIGPLSYKLEEIVIKTIDSCEFLSELIDLINNVDFTILNLSTNKIKNKIGLLINSFMLKINNFSFNEIYNFLSLLIISKKNNIMLNDVLLLFQNKFMTNLILSIIHDYNFINKNIEFVINLIPFLSNLKDINIFFDNYHTLLIKRLLSGQTDIENEKIVVNKLTNFFEKKYTNKICQVIYDITISNQNLAFYTNKYNINNLDLITTSYVYWDINYNEGYVNFNNIISERGFIKSSDNTLFLNIRNYHNYYNNIFGGKWMLIWLLHYGKVTIKYNNLIITLLPIQLLVLELFNDIDLISINDIKSKSFFENYSDKFKNDIINSLINSNILKNNKNICSLNNSSNISTDLIGQFMNSNIFTKPDTVQLAHNSEDIIRCLIKKFVKVQSYIKNDLYNLIKENTIKYFELNGELFNKSLDIMIKLDYVKINNDLIEYII